MSANRIDVDWSDVAKASRALDYLGVKATKELNPELRKIMRPYVKRAVRAAPLGLTGNLKRAIKLSVTTRKGVSVVVKSSSKDGGNRKPGPNKGFHSHFVYLGVAGRKGEKGRKALPTSKGPNPFLHRGVLSAREEMYEKLGEVLRDWITAGGQARMFVKDGR